MLQLHGLARREKSPRLVIGVLISIAIGVVSSYQANAAEDRFYAARQHMLEEIEQTVTITKGDTGRSVLSRDVMRALGSVPRHEFVPDRLHRMSYANRPLPIGHGQTISQPYIVALMTDLMDLGSDAVVLEVGTGSGYQAAVLAELTKRVYTMEIVEPLAHQARQRLSRLGYDNVEVRLGDGYYGWPEHGPYDAVMVTAAASHIPPPLVAQLRPGAKLVIPVGERFTVQHLLVVHKRTDGRIEVRQVLPVRFVPLTGDHD